MRWLRVNADQYGIDPTRIGVGGGSAGAVTSLLVGTISTDPGDSGNPGPPRRPAPRSRSPAYPAAGRAFYAADSPILMFNGTADPVVAHADGAQTAKISTTRRSRWSSRRSQDGGHVPMQQFGDRSSPSR